MTYVDQKRKRNEVVAVKYFRKEYILCILKLNLIKVINF